MAIGTLAHPSMSSESTSPTPEHLESPGDHTVSPSLLSSSPVPLRVKQHSSSAWVPTRGSLHATGYDLYSAKVKTIPACNWALINTKLSVTVPPGTHGQIALYSGLTTKFSIDAGVGVIDSNYQGLIYILLINHSDQGFQVGVGD